MQTLHDHNLMPTGQVIQARSHGAIPPFHRGDYVVVDDPHSVDQAASDTERHAAVEWWNGSMATRLNDLSSAMGGGGRTRGDGRRRHAQMHPRCTPDAPKTTKKSSLPT